MATTPNYSQPAIFSEVATPTVPDSGYLKVYANSGTLCSITNGGTEKSYVAISGSGLPIGAYTLPTTDGTASQILQTNGSGTVTWQTVSGGGGGGITSINGDTTAAQLLTVGTAGTNFAIDSITTPGTSVFNLPSASASARGLVTTGTQTFQGSKMIVGTLTVRSVGTGTGIIQDDGFGNTFFSTWADAGVTYIQSSASPIRYRASAHAFYTTGGSLNAISASAIGLNGDAWLTRDAADVIAQRNSTTAQTLRVYNTYTSATSGEYGQASWASNEFRIGTAVGSAGGTQRSTVIGAWNSAGTFSPWLTITNAGLPTFSTNTFTVAGSSTLTVSLASQVKMTGSFTLEMANSNSIASHGESKLVLVGGRATFSWQNTSFAAIDGIVTWGGSSSSFVGLKRSGTTLQVRLADDSALTGLQSGALTVTQVVATTGSPTALTVTGGAHTTLTASTEATDVNFNLARTVQFATGALTTQRAMRIQAPTYSFVGASTITTASTLSISGPPVAGTNATITTAFSLYSEGGLVGSAGDVVVTTATGAFGVRSGTAGSNRIQMKGGSGLEMASANYVAWGPNSTNVNSLDVYMYRDAAGTLALRNAANVQSFGVYNIYTSATSYERINVRGKASADFEIGPENGSAGGTLRGLTLGGYSAGSTTITPWLSFTSSGTPTFDQGTVVIPSGGTGLMCQQTNIYLDSYGTHSGIRYRRSEGTQGSPTGVAFNSLLGFVATYGYHGAGYHSTKGGSIDFYATEAFTSGAQGTKIVFGTTPNGTTTNTVALTIDQNQVATFSKLVAQSAAEITSTPSGTTQTITLNNGNHQTLTLTSSTGAVTVTLTVPSNVSSGTIIVKQHASTARDITWAVSAGTFRWMGTEPTWSSDAVSAVRIVSWRYDGSVMYLMSTDVAA